MLIALVFLAFAAFTVPEGYESDFASARECTPIDGRRVWEGDRAFYLQSCLLATCESGALADDVAAAIDKAGDSDLTDFERACND